ncbi:S-layer homology domain-containing protein [Paenibacillus sp. LHD-117]|uniref:S-layer homology domain-containing protein n=1 Tax=Paenibacillus sp. LHD-117 TaxID=3071412 RepID=UPI0027E18321|nr:S-layer homology domain-containing protein [Paenibacillus sp. LHD-117]MDQ6421439.1 S-layer homology domain-containing protein [Paenibacillus sp. LHD-117]
MIRKLFVFSLAMLLYVSVLPPKAAFADKDPAFTLSIMNNTPTVNQTFQVKVNGTKLNDLYAYEINLTYDSKRLKFVSSDSGSTGFTVEPILKGNTIQLAHTQIGNTAGKNGNATLATLTFRAVAMDSALISLSSLKLVNSKLESTVVSSRESVKANVKSDKGEQPTNGGSDPVNGLTDISGHWAKASIQEAIKLGFITGYDDGTFQPNEQTTRSEFAVMLSRALKLEGDEQDLPFADLNEIPAWARPSISRTIAAGILNGYDDNSFRPDQNITRSEMAVMIVRALGLKVDPNAKSPFADVDKIAEWARPSVTAAYEAGIIKGRGNNLFAPNEHATRAEAVMMILGMLQYGK